MRFEKLTTPAIVVSARKGETHNRHHKHPFLLVLSVPVFRLLYLYFKMPFFVLLLTPKVKKFELIHFQKTPEYVTVQVLLHQIIQLTQNVEFQEQQHIGFYCPKTKQQLLLGNIDCKEDASVATGSTDKESTDNYDPTKSIEETTSTNVTGDGNPCPTTLSSSSNKETTDSYQIPTEISTTASSPSNNTVTMDPVLDLESLGQILVAIPKDYKMSRIIKQANKILDSPAFRLLTANSLEQAENTTVAQELEQLKQQSLTTNVSQFLNEQVTYNQQATALHQEQQLDLEKRRISPKATAPDTHGLSPLDAMRVAQNQQKAAARQQERMTLQQYQRHLDTLVVDTTPSTTTNTTTTTTTTSALSTPDLKDLVTPASERTFPDFVSPNTDDGGNTTITTTPSNPPTNESNGMFVSSSLARRQSLEQQKQAELEAIRKQGLTQTIKNAAYFDPQESTATSKQMALQEQTKAELASLSNLSVSQHHKSWREMASSSTSSPTISPQVPSNRSLKQLFMTTTIPSSSNNNSNNTNETIKPELEELRRQGLTKAVSLHQVPALVRCMG